MHHGLREGSTIGLGSLGLFGQPFVHIEDLHLCERACNRGVTICQ